MKDMWVNTTITLFTQNSSPFVVSSSQGSSMGWNPSENRKELFDKRSRFMIARKPLEPGDEDQGFASEPQTTTPLAAFGMFRFDTEHDEEGEDEEVIYWSVRAFLVPSPLNDRCIPQLRGPGLNTCSTERSRKGNTRVDEAIRHKVQNEESCSHLSKRYCACFFVEDISHADDV